MNTIVTNLRDGYVDVVREVIETGERTSPRGQPTREVEDATIVLLNPLDALPVGVGRSLSLGIAAVEASQLVGGFSDPALMTRVARKFADYLDDGEFWGAYGRRIGTQVMDVCRKLHDDPDSRQAVITLWDPALDNVPGRKDYPCTVALHFLLRKNRLSLHVTMRSNDVWLGLAYDAFQFTQLQATVARALGVELGAYHHHATSLHIYERDLPAAEKLGPGGADEVEVPAAGFGRPGDSIGRCLSRASLIGKGAWASDDVTTSERWYLDILGQYR